MDEATAQPECTPLGPFPAELWLEVFGNSNYLDLKRMSQVNTTMRYLTNLNSFSNKLFRTPPTNTVISAPKGQETVHKDVRIHPACRRAGIFGEDHFFADVVLLDLTTLDPGCRELDEDNHQYETYHVLDVSGAGRVRQQLLQHPVAEELVTFPAVKNIIIVAGRHCFRDYHETLLSNDEGVTVRDVVEAVSAPFSHDGGTCAATRVAWCRCYNFNMRREVVWKSE